MLFIQLNDGKYGIECAIFIDYWEFSTGSCKIDQHTLIIT